MSRPFRLAAVLRVRESTREARRAQLADALRAAAVLEEQRAVVDSHVDRLAVDRRAASAGSETDVTWLLNANRYEASLRSQQRDLGENLAKIEAEIVRRREALAAAEREVRALELLRERDEAAARKVEQRREAKRLDEFAVVAHARRQATTYTSDTQG